MSTNAGPGTNPSQIPNESGSSGVQNAHVFVSDGASNIERVERKVGEHDRRELTVAEREQLRKRLNDKIEMRRMAKNGAGNAGVVITEAPLPAAVKSDSVQTTDMRSSSVLDTGFQMLEGAHALILYTPPEHTAPTKVGLLAERPGKLFGLPGGKLERGETIRAAAFRELKEELGSGVLYDYIKDKIESGARFEVSEAIDEESKRIFRCNFAAIYSNTRFQELKYYDLTPESLGQKDVEPYVTRVAMDAGLMSMNKVQYKSSPGEIPVKVNVKITNVRPQWLVELLKCEPDYSEKIRQVDMNLKRLLRTYMIMNKFKDDSLILSNPPSSLTYDMSSDCKLVGELGDIMKRSIVGLFDRMADMKCIKCSKKKFTVLRTEDEFKVTTECTCSWNDIWEVSGVPGGMP